MTRTKTIKILISCPGDVTHEKEEIKRLCGTFSNANLENSNITFHVLDWKDYVGYYGKRTQGQLNDFFGDYDTYIGILWKRFGTEPGSINSSGKENESGTEEEFFDALDRYQTHGKPNIRFFIKSYNREVNSLNEAEQIIKVFQFIEDQKKSNINYLNKFKSPEEFNSKIVALIKDLENQFLFVGKVEEKKTLNSEIKVKIASFKPQSTILPEVYLRRSTMHFKFLKDRQSSIFLEMEKQSLDQLMRTAKRVVLLGDAGSGKSTELANIYVKLNQEDSPLVPIYQNLNSYTSDLGFDSFLPDFWTEIPQDLLLIIWDGLDEIQPRDFNTVIRQINTFSEKHKEIRILISCRTNFYELPVNSTGTLSGFEPYILNDISVPEAREYYQKKYSDAQAGAFIREAFDTNLSDLITKPFFLMLLAEHYARERTLALNRAKLYEMFLVNRIELDQNHFKTTIDLRSKKQEIIKLLQRVALSMETLSKNQISESELLQLVSADEFNALKYCTAFKKKDGEDGTWQFEHNNIQEYLAAKALSNLEFDKVKSFITFEPQHNKLIPSWVNTLAFLFSILRAGDKLFEQLLKWMLQHEKEIIVKFEPDKIQEDHRISIFQSIFNHYKTHDIWINSNKFNERELARFGQSELNLRFLIEELENKKNTRIVLLNAIRVLGHFQLKDDSSRDEIELLLLDQIENYISDPNFIHATIYALKWAGLASRNTISHLMNMVGDKKNQYIRSAMYAILHNSEALEEYVEYLIEGYELTDVRINGERDDVRLMDEGWNLKECVKKIQSPEGIKKIMTYFAESTRYERGYDTREVMETIVNHAVVAYDKDNSIFDTVLSWFRSALREFRIEKINLIFEFFEQTNTKKKAFHQILNLDVTEQRNRTYAIAKLITSELTEFVIDEYLNERLTSWDMDKIYYEMRIVGSKHLDNYEDLVRKKANLEIQKPEEVDHKALRQARTKQDFDLLFEEDAFRKETLRVFDEEQKDILSSNELFKIRTENNRWQDMEASYSGVALRLLREFVTKGQSISKEKIISEFKNNENYEWYRVSRIYEYLKNHAELKISAQQKQWIAHWCRKNVEKVNFKEAIKVDENRQITINSMAMYIWSFSRKFDINHSKNVLLDMLSFDSFDGHDWIGIEHLVSRLDRKNVINRMLENIKEGIADDLVLQNHIKYLTLYKVEESYPFILNEIINTKRSNHRRTEFLNLFLEYTGNTKDLKKIIDQVDPAMKWVIIDKLKATNEISFAEKYLFNILIKSSDSAERGKAAEILITLENLEGLKAYVDWIKHNNESEINASRAVCLKSLKNKEAIPYLIELLEISYSEETKIDRPDRFNVCVLEALFDMSLVSEDNLKQVLSSLGKFMNEKLSIHPNVKFIQSWIERIEEQFYMNRAQSYTIKQVKQKLKLIEE